MQMLVRGMSAAQVSDAVGGGATSGLCCSADEAGDLGVGQAGEIVVGDGLTLFEGQRPDGVPQVGLGCAGNADGEGRSTKSSSGQAVVSPLTHDVDRLPVGDSDQPGLHVGVFREFGEGAESGQESIGPGVVGVDRADHDPADAQNSLAVLGDDALERSIHPPILGEERNAAHRNLLNWSIAANREIP